MEPKQAWGAFSIIVILSDAIATALLISIDIEPVLVLAVALIVLLVYFYVLYKRYHVEVVPENDIMLFDDPDDLRILCSIYGLGSTGDKPELRARLLRFSRIHDDSAFVWVAPKTVLFFGTALEIPPTPRVARTNSAKSLLKQKTRSAEKLSRIKKCPICDAKTPRKGSTCEECGADLEFYVALGGSKVGRLMVSRKEDEVRRKRFWDNSGGKGDG